MDSSTVVRTGDVGSGSDDGVTIVTLGSSDFSITASVVVVDGSMGTSFSSISSSLFSLFLFLPSTLSNKFFLMFGLLRFLLNEKGVLEEESTLNSCLEMVGLITEVLLTDAVLKNDGVKVLSRELSSTTGVWRRT